MSHYCCKKCGLRYDDCNCASVVAAPNVVKEKEVSKVFGVYTVHRDNDDRTAGPVTDVCSTKKNAETLAHRSGWYGGDAPIKTGWAVEVDGSVYLLVSANPVDLDGRLTEKTNKIKKEALSKLSPEEIEALGLNKE